MCNKVLLTTGALHISLMFIYKCVYDFCLFIHLFNYIYEHLLSAMYCASSFQGVISFLGCSMPFLPLASELYVVIPYFMDTSSRTMKTTAHELPRYYDEKT